MDVQIFMLNQKIGHIPRPLLHNLCMHLKENNRSFEWKESAHALYLNAPSNNIKLVFEPTPMVASIEKKTRALLAREDPELNQKSDTFSHEKIVISTLQTSDEDGQRFSVQITITLPMIDVKWLEYMQHIVENKLDCSCIISYKQQEQGDSRMMTIHPSNCKKSFLEEKADALAKSIAIITYTAPLNENHASKLFFTYLQHDRLKKTHQHIPPPAKSAVEIYLHIQSIKTETSIISLTDLSIKNNGTSTLTMPVVSFSLSPSKQIQLSSTIMPPDLMETYSVREAHRIKGWKYVYKDWQKKLEEIGEIWIQPIQAIQIAPGEEATVPTIQITVNKSTTTQLTAFVYFKTLPFQASSEMIRIKGTNS